MSIGVTITIEPEPHGYGQHMITVEREGWDTSQGMILTDEELAQLAALAGNYIGLKCAVRTGFMDSTGRETVPGSTSSPG